MSVSRVRPGHRTDRNGRAYADGRLVLPARVGGLELVAVHEASSLFNDWIACALWALRPDIAGWLLATFGAAIVPPDGGKLAGDRTSPHVAAALSWLNSARARNWAPVPVD